MSTTLCASEIVEKMANHAKAIKENRCETVRPGQPVNITGAWVDGDAVWQGDVAIVVREKFSDGKSIELADGAALTFYGKGKLAIGDGVGSRHNVDPKTVEMMVPVGWTVDGFLGPELKAKCDTVITHPVHGDVHVPEGTIVSIHYQRELDRFLQQERRARD